MKALEMRKLIVCVMERHPPQSSCGSSGVALASMLEAAIAKSGLSVSLERKKCLGLCLEGPNVRLFPDGKSWRRATPGDIPDMLAFLNKNNASK
jgi:(2Fe-2S) ferredoxin